jgi:hypothetical protein
MPSNGVWTQLHTQPVHNAVKLSLTQAVSFWPPTEPCPQRPCRNTAAADPDRVGDPGTEHCIIQTLPVPLMSPHLPHVPLGSGVLVT